MIYSLVCLTQQINYEDEDNDDDDDKISSRILNQNHKSSHVLLCMSRYS